MNKLANFIAAAGRAFKDAHRRSVVFSWTVSSAPQLGAAFGSVRAALDGGGPRSHGAAMTMIRNRFFGICREIICA
jgi:hypothetical protein